MKPLSNPFAAPSPEPMPRETRWGIARNGPPLNPAEVETAERAVEVMVLWDENVLHCEHLSPPRDVWLGEGGDFPLGEEALGVARLPVVVQRAGSLACVLPEGATGKVTVSGEDKAFEELAADGKLTAYSELPGARLFVMPDDATARIEHRGLTFVVRSTNAGRTVTGGASVPWGRYAWIAASLGVHALVLTMFYFLPPSSSALSLDIVDPDQRMVEYMQAAAAQQEEPEPEWMEQEAEPQEERGGERHQGDEGALGEESSERTNNRYAVERRSDEPERLARENAEEVIENMTAVGTLRSMLADWNSPTSPYGADTPNGQDPMGAMGALMGDQIGSNFGFNGLGMRGTGRGGGCVGDCSGIGLTRYNTLGNGGRGDGDYGRGVRLRNPERDSAVPRIITHRAEVMGQLSQEAIRRVVRRHLPEVRFCYEQGLQSNPSIEGRVRVSWIIAPTGSVQSSRVADSSLSNSSVEQCISQAVTRWTFPAPEGGGVVGVNYPFVLQTN